MTGTNTTNTIALPPYHSLGEPSEGVNPRKWVWMWLGSHQLHQLATYQRELNNIVVILVQTMGHAPICMQQVNMWEVLIKFSPEVDLCQSCEVLVEIEQWMGTSCHLCCEILDAEGLWAAKAKLWAAPIQDVEWVNPSNKHVLPPMGPVGRLHMYREELGKLGELIPTPTFYCQVSPPTQCTQLLNRIWGYHICP